MSDKKLKLDENGDGYVVAVGIALLIAAVLLVGFYVTMSPPSNATLEMYLLDSQGKAANYPTVVSQNSTLNVSINVENHNQTIVDCEVLLKVVNGTPFSYPLNAPVKANYENRSLGEGEKWSENVSVSIDEPGSYTVAFELWFRDQKTDSAWFSGYYCVLNVKVTT